MAGISHASFQQKNYLSVYHILHAFFTQPEPVYRRMRYAMTPVALLPRMSSRQRWRAPVVRPVAPDPRSSCPALAGRLRRRRRRASSRRSSRERSASSSSSRTAPAPAAPSAADFVAKSPPDGYTLRHHRHAARDQPAPVQEAAVRRAQGLHATQHDGVEGPYVLVVNPSSSPVNSVQRADRAREGQAGQDRLRELGQRQRAAPRGRALQSHGGRRAEPRAVQGQRAGDAGPARRRGRRLASPACRTSSATSQAGRLKALAVTHRQALGGAARRADDRRSGRARLRGARSGSASPAPPACRPTIVQRLSTEIAKALQGPGTAEQIPRRGRRSRRRRGDELCATCAPRTRSGARSCATPELRSTDQRLPSSLSSATTSSATIFLWLSFSASYFFDTQAGSAR